MLILCIFIDEVLYIHMNSKEEIVVYTVLKLQESIEIIMAYIILILMMFNMIVY